VAGQDGGAGAAGISDGGVSCHCFFPSFGVCERVEGLIA